MKSGKKVENRRRYRINPLRTWGITLILCGVIFWFIFILFTDYTVSALGAVLLLIPVRLKVRKELEHRYEKQIRKEFVSCLVMISGALSSGLRLEQCITEIALSDSREYTHIKGEFARMSKLVQLNWPAEKAFGELASRIPVTEIQLFSQALTYAVPAGVNLVELVRSFSSGIRIRNDVEAEITRTLNLPKYNNRIIMVMPFAMIAVMRLTAGDYLAALDSGIGNIVKVIVFAAIAAAFILGELIGNVDYAQ